MKAGWLIDAAALRSALADYPDCPITEIKGRMREGYPSRIGRIIYALGQRLLETRAGGAFFTTHVAAAAMVLTTYEEQTFADIFDEVKEPETDSADDFPGNVDDPWSSNKVLDEIDLDHWEVTPPHESVRKDAEYGILYGRYSSDN